MLLTTYRFQLREEFGFDDVRRLLDHLAALGISHLYLSPIFEARAGSTHGYDATDPTRVRAALGGEAAFDALVTAGRTRGIGIVLDIVPNHMAASEENLWLRDVLEFGPDSPFASHFDLSWRADPAARRVALPILGRPLEDAVREGEIELTADDLGLGVRYFQRRLPLDPRTWPLLLDVGSGAGAAVEFARLSTRDAAAARATRDAFVRRRREDPAFAAAIDRQLRNLAALEPGERARRLHQLLDAQPYELVFWRDIDRRLGYRRFFDITDLIGVRVEDVAVFKDTHRRIFDWVAAGSVSALRIDHVDGLLDPTGYLRRLRESCDERSTAGSVPILVEKILAHDEELPPDWPIDGTTGYEFLNALNGLFIEPAGLAAITDAYRAVTGFDLSFADLVYDRKKFVLSALFGGEWQVITRELRELGSAWPEPVAALEAALLEVTACLRVYRTYTREPEPVTGGDRARLEAAVEEASRRNPELESAALARISALLRLDPAGIAPAEAADALRWLLRWQQVTGPAMAKGLEDTALYTFYPLASANDVGGEPDHAVRSPGELHAFLAARRATPMTLNTTSTHDTKRSEDVRARLNVLSELPDEWNAAAARWRSMNARFREADAPDANEEYLLYQSIVGAWPVDELSRGDFAGRMQRYMEKALREAKRNTSWLEPDEAHEKAVSCFIERILDPSNRAFLDDLEVLVRRIAPAGVLNSLAQVAIKAWAPGVPDFYQGTESWAFDLVDPDNRRAVDFDSRGSALRNATLLLDAPDPAQAAVLLRNWEDGRIKVFVTAAAVRERAGAPALFSAGDYHPLEPAGSGADHLFGFARSHGAEWRALVVPRFVGATAAPDEAAPPWGDAFLRLPAGAPAAWRNVLTGERVQATDGALDAAALFATLPIALLHPDHAG